MKDRWGTKDAKAIRMIWVINIGEIMIKESLVEEYRQVAFSHILQDEIDHYLNREENLC